jgi:hypothetical protein
MELSFSYQGNHKLENSSQKRSELMGARQLKNGTFDPKAAQPTKPDDHT